MNTKLLFGLTAACVISGSIASAATIAPSYDTFGPLPAATFGGTGIPNNPVAVTTITNDGNTITLGLSATSRYPNPPVGAPLSNDGAGTFDAAVGFGLTPGRATWNIDYYFSLSKPVANLDTYDFKLLYTNNTTGASGLLDFGFLASGTVQDSQNLTFAFLGAPISFNANDYAQYGFELEAFDTSGNQLGKSAINVNVPDAGSTALLLGLGLGGLMVFGYRQSRLTA